ncbi:MAG: DEAD/DEAH box helicase, partial [Bacteroidaceae bacterium]|nr:DEAD/DEAH box helicase [Bacteroidaceae bacterium]
MISFNELGLCDELLRAIEEQGYEHPMPVQEAVIPYLTQESSEGDLVALAQTGTGKTAAYGLPLLHLLSHTPAPEGEDAKGLKAVILSPTRELCLQIADDLEGFSRYL